MDPRAVMRPVGPRPAWIYWARRLLVLAVFVVLIAGLIAVFADGDGRKQTAHPMPDASRSSASPAVGETANCRRADLSVTAATDAKTYPAGVLPHLSAVVRNDSDQPCRFRTAPARRIWTIASGADQVWSSADCTPDGGVGRARLRPGKSIAYSLVWNRHRSEDGCPATTDTAQPGTYRLDVSVNGVEAATVVFHLTD